MFRSPREEHAWLGQIDHLPSEISNQTKDEKPKSRKAEMQQETRRFENEFHLLSPKNEYGKCDRMQRLRHLRGTTGSHAEMHALLR